jgi:hypothetical protein
MKQATKANFKNDRLMFVLVVTDGWGESFTADVASMLHNKRVKEYLFDASEDFRKCDKGVLGREFVQWLMQEKEQLCGCPLPPQAPQCGLCLAASCSQLLHQHLCFCTVLQGLWLKRPAET